MAGIFDHILNEFPKSGHAEGKRAIGQHAARMVREGDVVIIDAGSTASQVAQALSGRKDLIGVTIIAV